MSSTPAAAPKKGLTLTHWILISMVLGILVGTFLPDIGKELKPISNIFLRMIKSLIVPLLFSILVIGIAGHGDDMKKVGRLALRSMAWAMGPGFAYQGRWPRFRTACLGRDWSAAAENCRMREDDSTHAAHNNVNASLFRVAAARVAGG